jgi:hypothetical protein
MICRVALVTSQKTPIATAVKTSILHRNISCNQQPSHTMKEFLHSMRQVLVKANIVPSSPILVTLMMEAPSSSETSVLTRAMWCNILQGTILHSHCRKDLKCYIGFIFVEDFFSEIVDSQLKSLLFCLILKFSLCLVLHLYVYISDHY